MTFWTGMLAGLFLGAALGFLVAGLCAAASLGDDR